MVRVSSQYKVRGQKVSSITSLTSHLDSFYPGNGSYLYHITMFHPGPCSPDSTHRHSLQYRCYSLSSLQMEFTLFEVQRMIIVCQFDSRNRLSSVKKSNPLSLFWLLNFHNSHLYSYFSFLLTN